MFTLFLLGNIASGKSTAARYLESRGALRIDLDELAKGLYVPGSDLVQDIASAFGWDVLDAEGGVRRHVLAARAFSTPEDTARLNALVHPALLRQLTHRLLPTECCTARVPAWPLAVVEVSAPAGFEDAFGLADGVVAVSAPRELRRQRAIERGMDAGDFDRRADVQSTEAELAALADAVIDNAAADDSLFAALDAYLAERGVDLGDAPDAAPAPAAGTAGVAAPAPAADRSPAGEAAHA